MKDFEIRTQKDLEDIIEEFGIIPFFFFFIPGFSIEEHTPAELWFTDEPGPWEWKGPVIRATGCAYGKYFEHKAAYISRKWFPDFANFRRDGYDFDARVDDELVAYTDKMLFNLLNENAPVLSRDLKRLGHYNRNENKGFDTIMSRLQAQCYVVISDFVYMKDRNGKEYGWGIAQYSTPEKMMGTDFTSKVYQRQPEESFEAVLNHLRELIPDIPEKTLARFLSGSGSAIKAAPGGEKAWLIPSNPKLYDIIKGFEQTDVHEWTQSNPNIRVGDTVYMYVGMPVGAVLFKCSVVDANIPWQTERGMKTLMKIRKIRTYPRDKLTREKMREFGVVNCRGPRFMPAELILELEKE